MVLNEIVERSKALGVYEKRTATDIYYEVVFYTKDTREWEKVLAGILGAAAKPPAVKPTKEDARITQEYGGIYQGQTLFRKQCGDSTVIAMFWPWQDGAHTTLKVALVGA